MKSHRLFYKWPKVFFKLTLFLLVCVAVERFCHAQTGGFHLNKIFSSHPFNPRWEVAPLPVEEQAIVDHLLTQPYRFYSYGGQSYVFLSEDGQTVLKFFKHHHMRTPRWIKKFPLPKALSHARTRWVKARKEKLPLFFNSCRIAYEDFKDRTGLLYLHLNTTSHFTKPVTLIDKLNIAHEIDLDRVDFALQKRAELPLDHLRRLKKSRDLRAAQESVDSLLRLIVQRCQRGIEDRDPNIRRNCGFIGNTAVEIDLGSYTRNETLKIPFVTKTHLYQQTRKLERWITRRYPALSPYFQQRLRELLEERPGGM